MTVVSSSISVVIPVYNSEDSLPLLIQRIEPILQSLTSHYELIFVNDGSRDNSWQRIQDLSASYPWIAGINLMRNYGQHNALLCGIRAARNEIVVTMDDDLQNPPEQIPALITKLHDGYDVVYGTPDKEQHGFWRNRASQISKLILQESMGAQTARKASNFRAFRKNVRSAFDHYQSAYVSIDVLLTWGTTRFTAIPVQHDTRRTGVSNYSFGKACQSRHEYDDRFQYGSFAACQPDGICDNLIWFLCSCLRVGKIFYPWSGCSGICISCLYHFNLRRSTDVFTGHHGRIPCKNPFPKHGKTTERRAQRYRFSEQEGLMDSIPSHVFLSDIDKERFGIQIARAPHVTFETLHSILHFCHAQTVKLLTARCDSNDLRSILAMESIGLFLADTLLCYRIRYPDSIYALC